MKAILDFNGFRKEIDITKTQFDNGFLELQMINNCAIKNNPLPTAILMFEISFGWDGEWIKDKKNKRIPVFYCESISIT